MAETTFLPATTGFDESNGSLRDVFERDGFAGPIKVYEPDEARALLAEIRLQNQDREFILHDNEVNYDRHFDVSALSSHISNPIIVRALRDLIGPDFLCWRSEFFPKFPGSAGTEWHQINDYAYGTGSPMLESATDDSVPYLDVSVWTAFTQSTKENGCMKFLPGSHKRLYYDERRPGKGREGEYRSVDAAGFFGYDFNDFKIDAEWIPDEHQAVALEMKPGECVVFTPRCVHGSFPNTTRRSTRFAITTRYVPTRVRVYPGWTTFRVHGGQFDLANYGCVLVSGEDRWGHNKLRAANNRGEPFIRHAL